MKWNRFICALAVTLFFGLVAFAAKHHTHSMSGTKSVTGCLQKGDEPGEFSITDAHGKTYGLRSSDVNLSEHLGHKVKVTGTVKPESEENEAAEQKEKGSKEVADIQVTHLKMVSASCP